MNTNDWAVSDALGTDELIAAEALTDGYDDGYDDPSWYNTD
jgi:hypothetical protein